MAIMGCSVRGSLLLFLFLGTCNLLPRSAAALDNPEVTVKLVDLIERKQYDAVHVELARPDMDIEQPTPAGKLPIIEAVRTHDLKMVDTLIQAQASVNVKDVATGITPIMLAFQAADTAIARLLLAYGADPRITAKNGKNATNVIPNAAIRELHTAWERAGAMAFEDPPGYWAKFHDAERDVVFWAHGVHEQRWNKPPSCAWQRVDHKDAPAEYVNYVTGQTTHRLPPSLSWRKIRTPEGVEAWHNWVTNHSQFEQPDEMPQELLEEASRNVNMYWYNEKTQEVSFVNPKDHMHWHAMTMEDAQGGEQTYYYNVVTGETQWEVPDELAWRKEDDGSEEGPFWHNVKTGESTWDVPAAEAWVKAHEDL